MKKTILCVVFAVCLGVIIGYVVMPDKIVYVGKEIETEKVPTLSELIAQKATDVMATQEFQEEMRATATARALYMLSIEQQDKAVELSEMAVMSNSRAVELSNKWHNVE